MADSAKSVAEEIVAAGWGPDDPCPECIEALKRPATANYLSPIDVIGIHWHQVVIHLSRRFGTDRKLSDEEWRQIEHIAFLHVVRTERVAGELSVERQKEAYRVVGAWYLERLVPARRRLDEQLKLHRDEAWWREHGREYEPAFTDSLLSHDQGFGDLEQDLRSLALARAMNEENSLTPEHRVRTTVEDLIGYIDLLAKYPLWRFTKTGQVRLDPKKVKTGLDGTIGRMETAPEEVSGEAQEAAEVFDVLDSLAAKEDLERARQILEARLAHAQPGSARHVVLRNFFELLRDGVTYQDLAQKSGLSDSALQEAFQAERAAIAVAFRAA